MRQITILLCTLMATASFALNREVKDAQQLADQALPSKTLQLAMTCTKAGTAEPAMYVFNARKRNGGFVIVSADERTMPILGYSDRGTFDAQHIPSGMQFWLDMLADEMSHLPAGYRAAATGTYQAVVPLLSSTWGQDEPFNNDCPVKYGYETPTGCVATAVAQVMNYWKYPYHAVADIPYYGDIYSKVMSDTIMMDSTYYDWDNMVDDYDNVETTPTEDAAVAKLMHHIGLVSKMSYEKNGSSALTTDAIMALFTHFGYDAGVRIISKTYSRTGYMLNEIAAELAAGRPVVMDGAKSARYGHAFVCDGIDQNGYLHINWGWNGLSNGYFRLSVLNPDEEGTGGSYAQGGLGYSTLDCNAYVGIRPEQGGDWQPAFFASNEYISKTRVAKDAGAHLSAGGVKLGWNKDLKVQLCAVLWDGDSIMGTYPMNYQHDAQYKYYMSPEYIAIPTSQFPIGTYQLEFGFQVEGFQGVSPINAEGTGERRYPIEVTADSVLFGTGERDVCLRILPDTTCHVDLSQGMTLHISGYKSGEIESLDVTASLQSDGWYQATVHTAIPSFSMTASYPGSVSDNTYWQTRINNNLSGITESVCITLHSVLEQSGRTTQTFHYLYPYEGDCPYAESTEAAYLPAVTADTVRYTVSVADSNNGSVSGAGTYAKGTRLFLTASPDANCQFVQWADGNTENPRMICLTSDTTMSAVFSEPAEPTAAAQTEAGNGTGIRRKLMVNGQLIILCDDRKYNALGIEIK